MMKRAVMLTAAFAIALSLRSSSPHAQACGANPIVCENSLPGNLPSEWDISGSGDSTIQGFTTDISVDQGQAVHFKISSTASAYRLDIYRLGYYGGLGARKVATIRPTIALPQTQPACLNDAATGLVDCGNWAESVAWTVPADAVSGIYIAKAVREAGAVGSSHIAFVVRDDDGRSDLLFQTSDTTWQAYNQYGGNSLYVGSPAGRAYKVSYNRPIATRETTPEDWVFNAEYPMLRWLEANGYNVSYSTGVDTDRSGAELLEHKVFMSVGHDEYWSGPQRENVEAARAAGVHLAFYSGNEVFWKTRWETSMDASHTSYRTLVTYKETHNNGPLDPSDPPIWTGTWRDSRFSPPGDGGRPENGLTGQIFTVNGRDIRSIKVPDTDGKMRFWRNTSIATLGAGATATLPLGTLGYEWDEDLDNGARPAGLVRLSTATYTVPSYLQDFGSTYATGTATHHLSLYRHASGALVFGAGTEQWSWGLDSNHDFAGDAPDVRMQQASVNLFADMGVQPATLQSGLTATTASTDSIAPSSTITSPAANATLTLGTPVTITGTATDTSGVVGGVEVSVDGGVTWHPAAGRQSWTYSWITSGSGFVTIKSRAVDDSGNLETASAGVTVTVPPPTGPTGYSIWNASTIPVGADADANRVEVGLKFRASAAGSITGIRFYKFSNNTGIHIGSLWSSTGTKLATATFAGETASGWQQVLFATPVAIAANTTYVASYHTNVGHYATNPAYFAAAGVTTGPLQALAEGVSGGNGVYRYTTNTSSIFPNQTFNSENYWVDVVFTMTGGPSDGIPPGVSAVTPVDDAREVSIATSVNATFSEAMDPATISASTVQLRDGTGALVAAAVSYSSATRTAILTPSVALATSTTYTATVRGGATDPRAKDVAGNALTASVSWSFNTVGGPDTMAPSVSAISPAHGATAIAITTPVTASFSEAMDASTINSSTVELRDSIGALTVSTVTYNSGTRTAALQPSSVLVAATTYTATVKGGATDPRAKDVAGNAVAANFTWSFTTAVLDTTPPAVTAVSPNLGATGVGTTPAVTATFSEAMDPATMSTATIELRTPANVLVAASVVYSSAAKTATLQPSAALAYSTTYTATVKGGAVDPRVKDAAGNALTNNMVWSFTTAAPPPPVSSIWAASITPAGADSDSSAVEVGVKFRTDVAGYITGLRFYKFASNSGTHTAHLWSRTGTLLATETFTGETASGWQQVNLSAPVAIAANTTYVASYYTTSGHYAVNSAYFAGAGVDNAPLHALANGVDGGNGVYGYGGNGSFPASTYNSENYWVDIVYAATIPPDTTAPVVNTVSPLNAATAVAAGTNVTATFSEAIDASTIGTSTFELHGPNNALIPAAVTYSAATRTATLDPTSTLASATTYTAIMRGSSGGAEGIGIKDLAGNEMAADYSWSFTIGAAPVCPCSIWSGTTTPAAADADSSAVEVGVKFRADIDGYITALRFYKFANNTGTHVGDLWTSTGTRLATVTFTGETASGWQQMTLPSPVPITANTTYVTAYSAPGGHYARNSAYFQAGVVNVPLRALADGVDGANGVYGYGPAGTFPTNSYNSENYWVDVVFALTLGPDTTPPTVSAVTPANGATGVASGTNTIATFSEGINAATVSGATIELRDPSGALVPAAIAYDYQSRSAILDPTAGLAYSTTYTGTVRGGAAGVKDLSGNALASDFTWSFTTSAAPPPPPTDGPGGPILVVSSTSNPYSRYYAEILRAEGLNAFAAVDLSTVTPAILAGYDVAILGEVPLTAAQVTMFVDWVNSGGNLIAMRPDKKLATLLGLSSLSSTLSNGYLLADVSAAPGAGIVNQTIQFHGTADVYSLSGATSVAALYSAPLASTPNPAISVNNVGPNGGHAAAFTYDLARSVIYTRQGNPAWSGQERDGFTPIRSNDLFFGASSIDSQPDWVNLDKVAIPQADEQQRLLANLVGYINQARKPLPRFWYFPRSLKAVVVMTGDDHAHGGTVGRFDGYKAASPAGCSVANWECVRGTSYIYSNTQISNANAAAYVAAGFEIGLHVNTNCADWTASTLQSFYTSQFNTFATTFPGVPTPVTHRIHCLVWTDYATQPQLELARGIRLDTNYYYWPMSWVADRPGFFTGSGMPMRFVDATGTLMDIYQATTQMTDESGQTFPMTINSLLDKAIGPEGYFGAFTANMHTDYTTGLGQQGSDAIVASAKARGVPVITARQLLTWVDGRNASSFQSLAWNGTALTFSVAVGTGANGLQTLVPTKVTAGTLTTITLNGSPVVFTTQTIKGVEYAIFTVAAGIYQATYTP